MTPSEPRQPISDFRSDTVTRPTAEMREAMKEARIGDDVFEEDPTIQELEATAAEVFGMQAGLFTPTGTMANLVALLTHLQPGDEVLPKEWAHTYNFEAALRDLIPAHGR